MSDVLIAPSILSSNFSCLADEIKAIDKLFSKGYKNIVYSLPFLTNVEELVEVKKLIKKYCNNNIKLGVFIETPAAVNDFELILKENIKFVYIGTKDLVQFILACDRSNKLVSHIYDGKARPVQKTINYLLKTAKEYNKEIYLFTILEDLEFYIENFSDLTSISICYGELKNLLKNG